MALFSQAPRNFTLVKKNEIPGPGQYAPSQREVPIQCAPFNTSASKSLSKSRTTTAPGPGDYNLTTEQSKNTVTINHNQLIVAGRERYQSVFSSRTQRFNKDFNPKINTPGPGQYQITQEKHHFRPQKMKRASQSMMRMSNPNKMGVPSIPTDVLGYKQLKNGQLVKIHPSNNHVVGPGTYQPKLSNRNHALNWSHTKAQDDGRIFLQTTSNSFVGPGAYEVKQNLLTSSRPVTSSFKSKSQKNVATIMHIKNPTPGPGAYDKDQSPFLIIPQQTHFGSKTTRFSNQAEGSPGPGSYGIDPQKQRPIYHRKQLTSAPFNSSSKKAPSFKSASKIGPGSYNPTKFLNQKATIIGFQQRFFDNRGITAPGPGSYTPQLPSRPKTTAVMCHQTIPLIKKQQTTAPTATSYTVQNFNIGKKSAASTAKPNTNHSQSAVKHPFNSSAERFYKRSSREIADQDESQLRAAIGKLTDKLIIRETTFEKPEIPFGSTANRTVFDLNTQVPDPAAYQDSQNDKWIKPSFNIKSATNSRTAKK